MLKLLALVPSCSPFYRYIKKGKKERKKRRKREKEKKGKKREKKERKKGKKGEKREKKERKMLLIKMDNLRGELKPKSGLRLISHKEFNEFIKGKGFKGRNEYKLKDLKAKFCFKPMYDRRTLTISSEGKSPTTFDSLRKAAAATGISYRVLIYAKTKERNFVKKDEKIYNINWHN